MSKKNRIVLETSLNVNDTVEVQAVSYSHEGMGICRYENIPIFVNKMLVGEVGKVMIKEIKPNYMIGVLISLLEKSPNRIKSDCKHYNMCGGCSLRHMNKEEQINFKSNLVKNNLFKYAKIDVSKVNVITSKKSNYRNKASFVATQVKNKIMLGFYKKNTHEVIEIEKCLINNNLDEIKDFCENVLNEIREQAYNQITNNGNIKHVIIRKSNIGEIQITVVTKDGKLTNEERFMDKISNRFSQVKSIIINTQFQKSNKILGNSQRVLFGDSFICDQIQNLRFKIGSQSFYQVNYDVMCSIYDEAISNLNLTKDDVLLDGFCGIGTISLLASKQAKEVIGIEYNKQAIDLAKANSKLNKIENVKFYSGLIENVVFDKKITFNKLVIDPARKGCDRKFIDFVGNSTCNEISYISCNSATLARDLKILIEEHGFKLNKIKAFDMFENTYHVETVVRLIREV